MTETSGRLIPLMIQSQDCALDWKWLLQQSWVKHYGSVVYSLEAASFRLATKRRSSIYTDL